MKADEECAQEVISFVKAVLQNCEVTDLAEKEVARIIRRHAYEDATRLIETAEKLLEWMPIYSKGSSGHIRQTNLRTAIDKFKLGTRR